ncbi:MULTISPECIES: DEAD/DEAH box helicase [unclassified Fusibacter]|uniref:DEAD/DEAH box helicase n=1 Tax=unclassified Fusibacter TaxID=2624464 RepID=UPI001011816D|nr:MULTISPECIES: helicase-related protein [unclassified Fusibacter]MCK8058416.1 DEAD/DEAH box helicase [Fusibacter sp. A2]NPE22816.1 DEAD/DEAH box helicase [Fusibacter sp. A1]RXV60370.1 helicase [Fusibacter sp. A1]
MYCVGDYAFDITKSEKVQILEKSEVWGFISYKVYHHSSGVIYKLSADQLSDTLSEFSYNESYLRYITLLSKIKSETSTGILANLTSGIIPLPHQLHVLNRALSSNNVRYILADEVGLGKTIEAGLIIKELKARGLVKRVLIVCPTGLVSQWELEMHEKFHEKFHVILPQDYDTIRKITSNEDVYGQFDQVLSPMDSIKPLEKRSGWSEEKIAKYNEDRIYSIINSGWDLVVIDEAHRVAGSSSEVARYKLGNLLSASSPYLLLLTATPHNGKTEPFLRLVRLVDEKAFPNFRAIVKEQVSPYVIRTEKREAIDNSGNKLFKNRITKIVALNWDERHSLQRELYEITTEYVSKGYNKAMRNRGKNMWFVFLLIMMQRLVTSSTSAIRQSIERRIKVLEDQSFKYQSMTEEDFLEMEMEGNMEEAIQTISLDIKDELEQLTKLVAIAKQAEYQYIDVKIEPLLNIIDNLFSEDKNRKLIIFTEFVATQDYLSNLLKSKGYSTSLLNGSLGMDERNTVLSEFKTQTNIMISTDAGGEGLNLQFSDCLINYDLPWNPMKIEQRIGRIDRIGQMRDVQIFNFILADTVENRVKDVLEQKLEVILNEVGIDKYSDVLDNEMAEVNFTDVYMNSIRNPKDINYNIKPVEEDLKRQVKNTLAVRDIIKDEKDLSTFVGTESNFDLENALQQMVTHYENYRGNPYLPIHNLSITDAIITKHLNSDIEFDIKGNVINVSIENFPNEKGYFMLWQLIIKNDSQAQRILPIFVNDKMLLRPVAGMKIWDAFLDEKVGLSTTDRKDIDKNIILDLEKISSDFAYDTFVSLKNEFEKRNDETYRKYMYALELRIEAAKRIGIENIRSHKLKSLAKEKAEVERNFIAGKQLCPEFKLMFLACLE